MLSSNDRQKIIEHILPFAQPIIPEESISHIIDTDIIHFYFTDLKIKFKIGQKNAGENIIIDSKDYTIKDNGGDGDCLFKSLLSALIRLNVQIDIDNHNTLRQTIVHEIANTDRIILQFGSGDDVEDVTLSDTILTQDIRLLDGTIKTDSTKEEYIAEMSKPGIWGGFLHAKTWCKPGVGRKPLKKGLKT